MHKVIWWAAGADARACTLEIDGDARGIIRLLIGGTIRSKPLGTRGRQVVLYDEDAPAMGAAPNRGAEGFAGNIVILDRDTYDRLYG